MGEPNRKESKIFPLFINRGDERHISIGFLRVALLGINQALGMVDALLELTAALKHPVRT